jgi:phosphatidate cytidylyltransferase
MLKTRLITATVLVSFLFLCVSYLNSKFAVSVFIFITLLFAGAEFVALRWHALDGFAHSDFSRPPHKKEHFLIALAFAFMPLVLSSGEYIFGLESSRSVSFVFVWIAACMILAATFLYRREIDLEIATGKFVNFLAGFVYIGIPGLTLLKISQIQINHAPPGVALYFALSVILMGDTGGYFVGKFFGKNKLIPKVSPKKTIEGALGGLLFSALTGVIFSVVFKFSVGPLYSGIIALFAGAAGQVGDLAESALKRVARCKDSSHILPGHGGVLDRIDALLFGIPFCYLIFVFFD